MTESAISDIILKGLDVFFNSSSLSKFYKTASSDIKSPGRMSVLLHVAGQGECYDQ